MISHDTNNLASEDYYTTRNLWHLSQAPDRHAKNVEVRSTTSDQAWKHAYTTLTDHLGVGYTLARGKLRGEYYTRLFEALEAQDWDAADWAATVLVNLGANDDNVWESANRRGVDPDVAMKAYDKMPVFGGGVDFDDFTPTSTARCTSSRRATAAAPASGSASRSTARRCVSAKRGSSSGAITRKRKRGHRHGYTHANET